MTEDTPALTALVLAGGTSRRMGQDKSAVDLGGRSLLGRALELAGSVADEVLLLGGTNELSVELPVHVKLVPDWAAPAGPVGALGAGLNAAKHDWCLLLPCDMPFVTPSVVAALRARAVTTDHDVVALASARGPEPFCALYRTRQVDELSAAVADGVESLTAWLDRVRVDTLDVGSVDPTLRVLTNVNTPADLAEALAGVTS